MRQSVKQWISEPGRQDGYKWKADLGRTRSPRRGHASVRIVPPSTYGDVAVPVPVLDGAHAAD